MRLLGACLYKCFSFAETCCVLFFFFWGAVGEGWGVGGGSGLGSFQYSRSESALLCGSIASVLFFCLLPFTHAHRQAKYYTQTSSLPPTPPFLERGGGVLAVGCTHLQPYYPASSAAARPALAGSLGCWSFSARHISTQHTLTPSADHQEFHQRKTCSEFRKSHGAYM